MATLSKKARDQVANATASQIGNIIQRYGDGEKIYRIAAAIGLEQSAVSELLHQSGVKVRGRQTEE